MCAGREFSCDVSFDTFLGDRDGVKVYLEIDFKELF